ncbi:MAG: response regulator transcription factor [Saprospiraceae bacterium]|nr:response regulator transcription factor [Saprospiraceae bacterium]
MATRAIIADNQKMFSEGLQHLLNGFKYPTLKIVGIAHTKEELLNLIKFPTDLLIMEIAINEGEGPKLISELKKACPNLKIIILSAYGESNLVKDAFIKGVDGYVLKANSSIDLAECIEDVMDGKTYIAEGLQLTPASSRSVNGASPTKSQKVYEDRFLIRQKLTKREKEILALIVQAKNNKEIARELYISDQTVSVHRKNIMKKLSVKNSVNLIRFAMDNRLV